MIVNDGRQGRFRLLRQIHGRGAFGEVHVNIRTARGGDERQVVWAVDAHVPSARPDQYPAETAAAIEGAGLALRLLESLGVDTGTWVVQIVFVGVNDADSEPSAVRAAATAAVVQAFGLAERCELVFDTEWRYMAKSDVA
jgi:hypothetical protein